MVMRDVSASPGEHVRQFSDVGRLAWDKRLLSERIGRGWVQKAHTGVPSADERDLAARIAATDHLGGR